MKIDFFLHDKTPNKILDYFTLKLFEALKRKGVDGSVHEMDTADPVGFLNDIQRDQPDLTLSFNGLLPDAKGRFFCDLINTPHIACIVDSPAWFVPLKDSSLSWATCIDRSYLDFFHGLGYDRTSFMTLAADRELFNAKKEDKVFDVTMLAFPIDIEEIEKTWKKETSDSMQRALHHAADITLRDPKVSFWQAFSEAVGIHNADEDIDFIVIIKLLRDLERYVNGKERLDFLRHTKGVTIDVFGDTKEKGSWSHYLKGEDHIRLHPPVSFEEQLKILQKSRITLNNIAKMRQGGSDRAFNAFALNTLPMSTESPYMEEFYEDETSILFNRWGSWQKNNDKLSRALNDKPFYNSLVEAGREITQKSHTWDNRADEIIDFSQKILS